VPSSLSQNKKKKKYKIKRKIDKRKNKMLGPKRSITEDDVSSIGWKWKAISRFT